MAATTAGTSGSSGVTRGSTAGGAQTGFRSGTEAVPDVTYNLISVMYHALQGCETYEQYANDAEQAGQQDIARYFRDALEENRQRAQRGQQLLSQCLMQQGGTTASQGQRPGQLHSDMSGSAGTQQSSGTQGTKQPG